MNPTCCDDTYPVERGVRTLEVWITEVLLYVFLQDMTLEECEHLVYVCCQVNAQTVLESYNIILYGAIHQLDLAKTALNKCTEKQTVLFCCNSTMMDSNGIV